MRHVHRAVVQMLPKKCSPNVIKAQANEAVVAERMTATTTLRGQLSSCQQVLRRPHCKQRVAVETCLLLLFSPGRRCHNRSVWCELLGVVVGIELSKLEDDMP
jgi:hypothetical protein